MRFRILPLLVALLALAPLHAPARQAPPAEAPAQAEPAATPAADAPALPATPAPPASDGDPAAPATPEDVPAADETSRPAAPAPAPPPEAGDAPAPAAGDRRPADDTPPASGGQSAPASDTPAPPSGEQRRPGDEPPATGGQPAPANDAPASDEAPAPADPAPDSEPVPPSDDPDAVESDATRIPLEEIRRYVGVFNAIRQGYVDPVSDRKLMQSAIRGLLLDLDPHSAYLEKSAAEAFDEGTTGAYDGIGVEVLQLPDGKVKVIAPIDGTPAAKAGIRSGDTIVAVDGKPLTPADAEGHGPLRGPPGTRAVLTVLREGETEPLEITVHRETIRVASVRGRLLEPGYGYVRISQFQVETGEDFAAKVRELQEKGPLKGLVIDLRSNPGGLLTSAVRVADDLLDSGGIVSTRGRNPVNDTEFNATPGDLLDGAPVVVIIDAGSASASEVLAGALHDNGRARIVGSRSFGKGSVQTVMPLGNGDAVKLTTARYYTPSGRSIQARGIDPDVVLKPDGDRATARPGRTEAMLPGHLRGDDEEEGGGPGDVLEGDGPIQAALAELKNPGSAARSASAKAPASPAPAAPSASTTAPEPAPTPAAEATPAPAPEAEAEPEPEPEGD